jgi:hypothetical protein
VIASAKASEDSGRLRRGSENGLLLRYLKYLTAVIFRR